MRLTTPTDTCPPHRPLLRPVRLSERQNKTPVWREREVKEYVTPEEVQQHRGPHGSLERKSLEDRGLRLARLRGRRRRRSARPSARRTSTRTTRTSASPTRPTSILRDAGFQADPQTEIVADPERQAHRRRTRPSGPTIARRRRTPCSRSRRSRTSARRSTPAHADQISADGRTAHGRVRHEGRRRRSRQKNIDAITAATDEVARRHPGFYVGEAGSISSGKALDEMFNKQLAQAGERSVPLTLLVLLLVFGALVAAGVPLLLALIGRARRRSASSRCRATSSRWTRTSAPSAARRPRRRRRLLALLPQARARGAGRRQGPPRRARGRRRHLRPLGADLRRDRDDRDGRDAVLRRQDATCRSGSPR